MRGTDGGTAMGPGDLPRSLHGVPESPDIGGPHHWMRTAEGLSSTFRDIPRQVPGPHGLMP